MADRPENLELVFAEEFDDPDLDRSVWLPHYLPAWSSRASTAATYEIKDSCLVLTIPPTAGLWCADRHTSPMRVSGIQTGNFSGPVGSTVGQQPFRDGLTVREEQETVQGWTPHAGYIELRARAVITPGAMVAFWMVGFEDQPERSAEICVAEIFGNAILPGESAAVGMGLHQFRDPAVVEDFEAVRLPIDVAHFHSYAVDWRTGRVDFLVDGAVVRSCSNPPAYPMQMMVAVFDFPDQLSDDEGDAQPALIIDYLRGYE